MNNLERLKNWASSMVAIDLEIDEAARLLNIDCTLLQQVYAMMDDYTKSVAALVGDDNDWLGWYLTECDLGRKPKSAKSGSFDGLVASAEDLLAIVESD